MYIESLVGLFLILVLITSTSIAARSALTSTQHAHLVQRYLSATNNEVSRLKTTPLPTPPNHYSLGPNAELALRCDELESTIFSAPAKHCATKLLSPRSASIPLQFYIFPTESLP